MARNASATARELVARFRRQRPLRGGSLIITIFGDSIMPRGGAVSLGSLIALGAPFGLNERLVRTAISLGYPDEDARRSWPQYRSCARPSRSIDADRDTTPRS